MKRPWGIRGAVLAALLLAVPAGTATSAAPAGPPPARGGGTGSPGCGTDPGQRPGSTVQRTLNSGGVQRTYRVHLPEHYRPGRPHPVVLAFHGQGKTAAYMEQLTGFSGQQHTIAVYPQGVRGTEDGKPSWQGAPYSAPGVDDVRFTSELINRLERDLCVDRDRVHAAGKSNGGAFVAMLACRMPNRIASFAAVSGAYYPQAGSCRPPGGASSAPPLLTMHGGADTTIPYAGEPAKGLPPIRQWLADRAALAHCAPASRDRNLGHGVTRRVWHGCAGRSALVHYRVATLAHNWPSTHPNPDSHTPSVLNATPLIERFMREHPLRR